MKQLLSISLLSFSILFFSACSTKRVFEPVDVKANWNKYESLEKPLVEVTPDLAMLEDRKIISKNISIDVTVDEGYRLLTRSDGWIITSSIDGKLKLRQIDASNITEEFELKKTIATASVDDDILAVLFSDNEMALYSIKTKKLLFKEQGANILAVDTRIMRPHFLNGVVVFPTLDGKIVIVNRKTKKKLRATIISSEDSFNNVIFFDVIGTKIIAATAYQILSMSGKNIRQKYEIRSVSHNEKNIFIMTKQGELVSLTLDLQLNAKMKFPFAHFLGMLVHDDKIYALEKEGYLVVAPTDLSSFEVYEVDMDNGFVFIGDDEFYVHNKSIVIK